MKKDNKKAVVKSIFLIQLASCWFMTGLIWIVQVVHYPLFAKVGVEAYRAYQEAHMRTITYVVMPTMLVELATACLLVFFVLQKSENMPSAPLLIANLVMLILIWASTFFIQVPYHSALTQGLDPEAIQKLVTTNWIRTFLWTARGVLLIWALRLWWA